MSELLLTPAPDFGQPLELLSACHQRIQTQCATMLKLLAHCAAHGSDGEAATAAVAVLKYFATAAVHHHEDEEEDLFPTLRSVLQGDHAERVAVLTTNLARQHRDLEAAWQPVKAWLEAVAQGRQAQADEAAVTALVLLYQRHIELEESELLPLSRKVLTAQQQAELGRRMAQRRGIAWTL